MTTHKQMIGFVASHYPIIEEDFDDGPESLFWPNYEPEEGRKPAHPLKEGWQQ